MDRQSGAGTGLVGVRTGTVHCWRWQGKAAGHMGSRLLWGRIGEGADWSMSAPQNCLCGPQAQTIAQPMARCFNAKHSKQSKKRFGCQ